MADTKVKYSADKVRIADGKKGSRTKGRPPITLFDRCEGTLFNLHFKLPAMEELYLDCSFPLSRGLFRFAMVYLMLIGIVWIVFFPLQGQDWLGYVIGAAIVVVIAAVCLGLSCTNIFRKQYLWISLGISITVGIIFLLSFLMTPPSVSVVFNLALIVQLILLMYTLIPVRLWMALALGACFTVCYEILIILHYKCDSWRFIVATILLNVAVHLVGFIIHIMAQVCRRSTFIKLCQSAHLQKDIEMEQKSKYDFIRSLMPDKVANDVMQECENMGVGAGADDGIGSDDDSDKHSAHEDKLEVDSDVESGTHLESVKTKDMVTFRKFHVSQMTNVSILFADIVGFTKMSSNKTATQLVWLLNDLFGRFDKLCAITQCEKIATLGDCYYCVSGCPNPEEDHAVRCVEMGRAMCTAIQQFDEDFDQEVNMRVGVHTGMVICGIVGTRRFKFDVWSNDVTLANEMESSGEPGHVHISESTLEFVKDIYEVRTGEPVPDIRKIKVLIEYFDEKLKCYAIKHKQDQSMIDTFFIIKRFDGNPVVELPRIKRHALGMGPENTEVTSEKTTDDDKTALTKPTAKSRDNDAVLVEVMRANDKLDEVFYFPPISTITLNFTDPKLETVYRNLMLTRPSAKSSLTWATPRITAMIEGVTTVVYVLLVMLACFLAFGYGGDYTPRYYGIFFGVIFFTVVLLLLFVSPLIIDLATWGHINAGFVSFYRGLFSWYPRNILGAFVMLTPTLLVLSNFRCCQSAVAGNWGYLTTTAAMHLFMVCNFTLFTMFSSWTKSVMATLAVVLSLLLVHVPGFLSLSNCPASSPYDRYLDPLWINDTSDPMADRDKLWARGWSSIQYEMTAYLLLTLVLVWFLNREFDIRFRMSCECDHRAQVEKEKISRERRQADWLLENIIPKYISESVKTEKKYSQHVQDVGVIFATIANFADFYDEQYEGGKEMLRVLNEIFADFENLLGSAKYKDVEKIKSIGACFMAASGLNTVERARNKKPIAHLYQLMDFCVDVLKTIEEFNLQIFNFDFELKIGYNIGDVTAGVIGSTKLLYDIWGDTVNVSSRMYSTGSKGRIQVTKAVADILSDRYEFEYRGDVTVKGKGIMQTYLLVKKKTDASKA